MRRRASDVALASIASSIGLRRPPTSTVSVNEAAGQCLSLDNKPVRAALLSLFTETVLVGGRRNPMLLAIEASATSLARALTGGGTGLALPQGLPLDTDLLDGAEAG